VPLVREVIQEWEGSASRAKKIAASLLAAMAAGQPAILHDLPGSGELAVQWGVPQPTVSAAKKLIAAYGVIKLTPNGKRYYVARHVSADSLIAAADAKLSTAQAAAEAGVSKRTIVRWAEEGRLPATLTAGGHRRYDLADVQAARQRTAGERLSTGQAARELGVGVTTLLAWADAGLVKATRTAGGHRRFNRADLGSTSRPATSPLQPASSDHAAILSAATAAQHLIQHHQHLIPPGLLQALAAFHATLASQLNGQASTPGDAGSPHPAAGPPPAAGRNHP
jgi:excisionase family DNA binding protein